MRSQLNVFLSPFLFNDWHIYKGNRDWLCIMCNCQCWSLFDVLNLSSKWSNLTTQDV